MIGELLGNRYEILEKIGEGGMSTVYKARCNKLNRYVAVKILKNEFADNEDVVKKFKIEATAIATLSDNNIVNVLDVGSQDKINYIVMEFVKGKTLKEVIKQYGSLNYETTLSVGIQIARALECAHKNGIIHRDVKPQNILVTEEGLVKVTDFGIAKSSSSATLTTTTTIMGSAHYFSPEQAKGSVVDVRTDLYSFGVVLYEMATGKLPFEGDSPVTIALKHIQEEVVPPKSINSKIPDSLNDLIMKAMAKEPDKRYQTAKEMLGDLQKIKDNPNAKILEDNLSNDMDGHTIIMNPVNQDIINNKNLDDGDEYYDDDYYDDDYYDDEYDEDESVNKKKKKKKIIIGVVASIAAVVLLFVVGFFVFGGGNAPTTEKVKVPTITGLSLEEAKSVVEKAGLEFVDAGTEKSDKEEGTVLEVDPSEGTEVEKGSKVRVITSSGEEKVKMPEFENSDLDTVKIFLKKNNVTNVSEVKEYSDTVKEGLVIRTEPGKDTELTKDTKVTIYISKGKKVEYVSVGKYSGMNEDDAKTQAQKDGLTVYAEYVDTSNESEDKKVISQSQNYGTQLEKGSAITLTIGRYKEPEKKKVNLDNILQPNMGYEGAITALKTYNLKYSVTGDKTGTLQSWSPHGEVEEGTTINLVFSKTQENDNNNDNNH
ncbi:MAG: Stk1 family PASTA domain-containing Ser/Thr kinase [Clostridiales bacterium]|nr:Stk1 family PASTA domain-containing Ser/Thr kinase [Clostridiales bacterium]